MDYIIKAYKDWKLHSQFHEIVPDMDDEFVFNEKQSIRDSARTLKKYGSTCCNQTIHSNETLIRHEVEKTDTLQGIALKYGCTTEQIRRANRLFTSDSLFLRQFLLVPVDKSSPYFPKSSDEDDTASAASMTTLDDPLKRPTSAARSPLSSTSSSSTSTTDGGDNPRPSELPTRPYSIAGEVLQVQAGERSDELPNNCTSNANKQSKSLDSVAAMTPEEENRRCINEFLSKIDTTISESRKYVEKSREMIAVSQSDDDLFVTTDFARRHRRENHLDSSYKNQRHHHHRQQQRQQQQQQQQQRHVRHSSTGSNSDMAQLLNTTQTRHVQNSLKRLEKQQDEFFEL